MSLRLRLLLALVGLVCIGLLLADVATYLSLRSFLLERVDQQLVAARVPVLRALSEGGRISLSDLGVSPGEVPQLPPGTYGEVLDTAGEALATVTFTYGGSVAVPAALPDELVAELTSRPGKQILTVRAAVGDVDFRVLAWRGAGTSYIAVVGLPLTEVAGTMRRLIVVEALVTVGVLFGLAALGWWLVRRELRPLEDMAVAAGAIAGGDLSRRVEPADPRTEVGRLGLALNAMLTQIEQAFARRTASENALRRFLAQASHELRTPLASIRGYAELFRRGAKDRPHDLELAMRRIEQEAARMGVLVEDLLLLARLDESRPLERHPVDLARLAADTVADARITASERVITCEAPAPVIVPGDEARLRQVATNLVTNALRHAGAEAHVYVGARERDGWAQLEVRDDGAGMAAEVAERAFEPFFSAAADADAVLGDTQGRRSATGLGLSIALGIVQAHGGRIDLHTALGEGTRLEVWLPLTAMSEDGELAASPSPADDQSVADCSG